MVIDFLILYIVWETFKMFLWNSKKVGSSGTSHVGSSATRPGPGAMSSHCGPHAPLRPLTFSSPGSSPGDHQHWCMSCEEDSWPDVLGQGTLALRLDGGDSTTGSTTTTWKWWLRLKFLFPRQTRTHQRRNQSVAGEGHQLFHTLPKHLDWLQVHKEPPAFWWVWSQVQVADRKLLNVILLSTNALPPLKLH